MFGLCKINRIQTNKVPLQVINNAVFLSYPQVSFYLRPQYLHIDLCILEELEVVCEQLERTDPQIMASKDNKNEDYENSPGSF